MRACWKISHRACDKSLDVATTTEQTASARCLSSRSPEVVVLGHRDCNLVPFSHLTLLQSLWRGTFALPNYRIVCSHHLWNAQPHQWIIRISMRQYLSSLNYFTPNRWNFTDYFYSAAFCTFLFLQSCGVWIMSWLLSGAPVSQHTSGPLKTGMGSLSVPLFLVLEGMEARGGSF